mmetsp:Transcript_37183/g.71308  ORF Transcript_37183/g.71308 Transcript_37183/m.71308 type:complete len:212 (+) Transcript_37183:3677-4312(+)
MRSSTARPSAITGTVKVSSGTMPEANERSSVSYTHSVIRSCTMEANLASSSLVSPASDLSKKRRDTSSRVTWSSPHERAMDTAFALSAVEKFMRGPTSTTCAPGPAASWLPLVSRSGSNVSFSSHSRDAQSSWERSLASSTLKHCSVSTAVTPGMAFCTLCRSVASAVSPSMGVRYHWRTPACVACALDAAPSAMAAFTWQARRAVLGRQT